MDEEGVNEEPAPGSCSDPTEFLKLKPKKSILKSSSRQQTYVLSVYIFLPIAYLFRCPEQRGAHFDEMNILATLHPPDKDYGFMKIEEPKTPYSYLSEGELDDGPSDSHRRVSLCDVPNIDPSALQEMYNCLLSRQLRSASPYSLDAESDSDSETEEQRAKRLEFEKKRKLHYNEFRAMQKAKERLRNDEDTDKEDGEQASTTPM
ncbi:phosphoprotein phosphatase inhibitor 2 [Trichuris trichiura]|uniref:Phosphoprotein phosphatase inhibitor 2 n=1 Tax=Trichuris trichiura TaxID=36087 RepID=A0A077Z1W6_TRITR|nr:phosphoprotein phosphatase inhibitor 2 [Trichuris trichiura]